LRLERLEDRATPSILGTFELDGNVQTGVLGSSGSTTTSHDWDQVFADAGSPATSGTFTQGPTSAALAGSFFTDKVSSNTDDIFTGGGSKDTNGIQQGQWLFTGSKPQGKDDITHAYASAYLDSNNHLILYAGMDRFDNSGDSTAGFWFFGNNIGQNPNVTKNGGHPFTGTHQDGDILLVSDFTVGGSTSTIKVFRWTGNDSTGSLVPLNNGNPIAGNTFAIVNSGPISAPWSYTNKSGQNQPAAGEFLEEGVDLTALGLQGCFSTFMAETRSSQSPTATLSDFVLGSFPLCSLAATPFNGLSKFDTSLNQGDTVTYPLTVTNSGGSPLFIQSVSDSLLGNVVVNHTLQAPTAPVTSITTSFNFSQPLAPGASLTIFVTRPVQQTDPDPTVSTVSYVGTDDLAGLEDPITASATNTVNLFQPSMTLTETASPATATQLGQVITYTFTITNTSSADSPNLVLDTSDPNNFFTDSLLGNLEADAIHAATGDNTATVASIAPGATFTLTETRAIQAGDPNPLTDTSNVAFTLAQDLGTFPNIISASASASVTLVPQLTITKAITDGIDVIHPGDTASFTITVTNDGSAAATNVVATDQLPDANLLTWTVTSSTFDTTSIDNTGFLTAMTASLPAGATISVVVSAAVPLDFFGNSGGTGNGDPVPLNLFELDGNATTGVLGTSGSTTTSHDWDQVFADNSANPKTNTAAALASAFQTDPISTSHDDIFTGGSSKDTNDITQWQFKSGKPQGKDDIENAFASLYRDPATNDVTLYAGLDRFDNSGDSTAGFWFFVNPVTQNANGTFNGAHANGDILLVSDFTVGGSVSTIRVFEWLNGNLTPLNGGNPITGATFAIVNSGPISVPWSYVNKSGAHQPAAGEFLEEGINLSSLGLNPCFSSFLAETRSSQSTTATLSDIVLGPNFQTCDVMLPNQASVSASNFNNGQPITSNTVIIDLNDGMPELAASVGSGAATASLTEAQLQPAVAQAVAAWRAAGADPSALSNIANYAIHIANLPDGELGYEVPGQIWIDATAQGWGWSTAGAPGGMDLETVVTHELGHVLGFRDGDPGVMEAALAPGVRLAPGPLTGSGTDTFLVPGASMNGVGVGSGTIANVTPTLVNGGATVIASPVVLLSTAARTGASDTASATAVSVVMLPTAAASFQMEVGTFRGLAGVPLNLAPPILAVPAAVTTAPAGGVVGSDREIPSNIVLASRPPVGGVESTGVRAALTSDEVQVFDPRALPSRTNPGDLRLDQDDESTLDVLLRQRAFDACLDDGVWMANLIKPDRSLPLVDTPVDAWTSVAGPDESDGSLPEVDSNPAVAAMVFALVLGGCWGTHRVRPGSRTGRRLLMSRLHDHSPV
jgi:uncharacterized repeat protein (TIGR01451 family)